MDDIKAKLRDDSRHVLWAQDRVRLYAADYIERLEAVVRAGDEMEAARDRIGQTERGTRERLAVVRVLNAAETKYDAARSRVNLSSQAALDNSVSDGHEHTDKCGDDCTLEVLRPGQVQCGRDGAKCPNRKASNGKEA